MIPAEEDIKIIMNIGQDPESINYLIKEFNDKLKSIEQQNQSKKNIGDVVYYSVGNKKVISAKIVDIDEYPCDNGETNYFYWVTPVSSLVRWTEHLRYKWSVITKTAYIPGKWFFTNSVQLGKDIFLSEEDAEKAYLLNNAIFYLWELTEHYE